MEGTLTHEWNEWAFWASDPESLRNLAIALGALLAGAIGLPLAIVRTLAARKSAKAAADQQVTNAFTSAVDHLGSKEIEVRLGGIYALERVARENQALHWPIMETLTAFFREASHRLRNAENAEPERSNEEEDAKDVEASKYRELPTDMRAILTVLNRRHKQHEDGRSRRQKIADHLRPIPLLSKRIGQTSTPRRQRLNLSKCYLANTNLERFSFAGIDLTQADLRNANLREASLIGAKLTGANLVGAHLGDADLDIASLEEANLVGANLHNADLLVAGLAGANLRDAVLTRARLVGADLRKAILRDADLRNADLSDADLRDTDMRSASLHNADLSNAKLEGAYTKDTILDKPDTTKQPT